jgi:hypothetical protein
VSEDDLLFSMKVELRYHVGVLKEQLMTFDRDNKIALDPIAMRYTYDGNARLAGIVTQIGQQDNESVLYKYKSGGRLEVSFFFILALGRTYSKVMGTKGLTRGNHFKGDTNAIM